MGRKSPTVKVFALGLTAEEREALDEIADSEDVSMASILRDLLATKYPRFAEVHRPRSGYGGGGRREAT